MEQDSQTKIGEEFRPVPQLKSLYYSYLLIVIVFGILIWDIPLLIFLPSVAILISVPILVIVFFAVYWIYNYYNTIFYKLTENEITWRRGVWFRNTGIVPYNRITNIDITQGPISRKFRIASLRIQTAGYSGTSGGTGRAAEIQIEGMQHFEELREMIMDLVRGRKPVGAVGTYEQTKDSSVLEELVKIRKLLEKKR